MYITRKTATEEDYFSKRGSSKNENVNRSLNRNAVTKNGTGLLGVDTATLRTSDSIYNYNKSRSQKVTFNLNFLLILLTTAYYIWYPGDIGSQQYQIKISLLDVSSSIFPQQS